MFNAVALGARQLGRSCAELADLIDRIRAAVLGAAAEAAADMSPWDLPAQLLGRRTWGLTELELLVATGMLTWDYLQSYSDEYLRQLQQLVDQLSPADQARLERLSVPAASTEPVGVGLTDVSEVVGLGLRGSAWDQIAGPHPTPDTVHITPSKITHILDGNASGGGHASGTGVPGKSEFPPGWSREKVIAEAFRVARDPTSTDGPQKWDRWRVEGVREGVTIRVILEATGEVVTAFPIDGPGVVKNPKK